MKHSSNPPVALSPCLWEALFGVWLWNIYALGLSLPFSTKTLSPKSKMAHQFYNFHMSPSPSKPSRWTKSISFAVSIILSAPGRTPSDFSWWSKPNVWDNSGLDVGYWSSECEAWFKDCVDDINNSEAWLRTNDDW
ncbi:hypothetical protein M422DRAFT_261156 [Sphaerobolus stellatus SS14]|uniref:Uncharacterized protein n=1 Tax=Sphaerobolus stellatus (strain SS14) TaxID=990650 RepID=A0A0C9VGF6_SPHS4|nr:hypothetical protein M422DRAFT_261152 [Sphaerobolus stellatus SS14]KIJ36415.1 hypothetical protein M422DRAFT_261156 [Sphaerobolus stellatus SS14]